jgi:hypothetical protein
MTTGAAHNTDLLHFLFGSVVEELYVCVFLANALQRARQKDLHLLGACCGKEKKKKGRMSGMEQ